MSAYLPFAFGFAIPCVIANLIALGCRPGKGGGGFTALLVVSGLISLCAEPAVFLELIVLAVLWSACRTPGTSRAKFAISSTVGTLLVVLILAAPRVIQFERLKAKYPFESMAARIPAPPPATRAYANLKDVMADRLNNLEEELSRSDLWPRHGGRRGDALYRLHEETSQAFIRSAGFGVIRTIRVDPTALDSIEPPIVPIAQPDHRDPSTGDWSDPGLTKAILPDKSLFELHTLSIMDFANPRGYGYVKSREKVAGFRPHHFREQPESSGRLKLQTLDLVGLLMHEEPVTYVSEHLPRMDELKDAPTRALDAFEEMGLKEIQKGDDLYARESGAALRLLGAIRATKQCTTCHACDRGDLLGAFSYTLKRE